MPITRNEFESRQILTQLDRRIVTFLERNRTQAFTSNEIMDGINFQTDFSNLIVGLLSGVSILGFPIILNNLVMKGKIKANIIQGQYYYMAKQKP